MRIDDLKPAEYALTCQVPALFLHAEEDTLIPFEQTETNMDAYGSNDKEVEVFSGDHNSERPDSALQKVVEFFVKHLAD